MDIKKFFQKKKEDAPQEQTVQEPQPLAIEGIPEAPLTPEPDDAEIAAQALLEHLMAAASDKGHHNGKTKSRDNGNVARRDNGKAARRDNDITVSRDNEKEEAATPRDADYYRHLAAKMRMAREATRLRVTRFLAFVEQELKKPHLPTFGDGSLGLLEAELYKRLDIVEHEGGELLRRWQHCLALVTVRLMQATKHHEDSSSTTDDTDFSSTTN